MDRGDVTVNSTNPISEKAIYELRRMPGVQHVEPVRVVPAILRTGRYSHRGVVEGIALDARLYRAVDADWLGDRAAGKVDRAGHRAAGPCRSRRERR